MQNAINVLNKGFVKLINFTENADILVVSSARVSFGKIAKTPDEDRKLIRYLLANSHSSPFEHNSFTFSIKTPLFVRSQWHRHRVGISYNEISARYTEMKEEFYVPQSWRAQDTKNKQGSLVSETLDQERLTNELLYANEKAINAYRELLKHGVAREMARLVLPVNLYTEFFFTCNARSLMHFIGLRSEAHAQWEIRQYSNILADIFRQLMPWTYEAFYATLDKTKYPELPEPVGLAKA